jgi:hypothetical protein
MEGHFMTIDIHSDEVLTLSQAAKRLPNHPHVSTVWRWHLRGIRGVHLETILIGGQRYTSAEALQLFIEQTTAATAGKLKPERTDRQRRRAQKAAERDLAKAGI